MHPSSRPTRHLRTFSLVLLAVAGLLAGSPVQADGRNLLRIHQEKHQELHTEFAAQIEEIARLAEQSQFTVEAAEIRQLSAPLETQIRNVDSLPENVLPEIRHDLPAAEREWRIKLRAAQSDYGKELYLLSRRVLSAGHPSYAYQLVREAAHHDPDNKAARRLLGYVRHGDQWLTPFAASMERKRFVWHDRFGWLPKNHVERYENGERNFNGTWVTARKEAELRRDFDNAWAVRTEHFLVKTNHSLERGVEVAKALETFYEVFYQTFAAFFNTPEQMQKLFEGTGLSRSPLRNRPHEVHYFATRDEYNERLISKIPQIAITNGLYYTPDRVSYFYHDAAAESDATLFHEATHQLFYESVSRHRAVGEKDSFWIIEGIACYMESFDRQKGRVALGNPRYVRFNAARYRLLNDGYYVPLAKFAAMGMHEFQNDPNISRNYSQASGLAHFFMHYDGGRYRDALIKHLAQHYNGSGNNLASVQTLAELTGTEYEELDRQYAEFVRAVEASLSAQVRRAN